MPVPSPEELLAFLQEHGFLTPSQLQHVRGNGQTKFADARDLARELVDRNWLTPYQANQLLQGNGADLLLGPYRILDRLGAGGMGQVFKAYHVSMDRIIALKLIPRDRVSDPTALARFNREVRAVAKLSHPNIVIAFEVNQSGQTPYLAMEYVAGIDLARLVQQSGPLPIPRACEYVRQAAAGLQHAHEKGLVHRDIKPGNLIVARPNGDAAPVIKILDFGLARFESESGQAARLTQLGKVVGTVDYVAPEQAENARTADIRADIYSLGCTLFYLLTGMPPFQGDDLVEKLGARLQGNAPLVRESRPEVSPALEGILAKMLARNPNDRYQMPGDVAKALEPHARDDRQPASSATRISVAATLTSLQPAAERQRRHIVKGFVWMAMGCAGVVLLFGIVAGFIAVIGLNSARNDNKATAIVGGENLDGNTKPSAKASDAKKTAASATPEIWPTIWKTLASMPTARSLLAAATSPDGRIYAIGGEDDRGRLDTVEVYDPSTNTWAKAAPMPTARNHLAAAVGSNNRIYAIGGANSPNTVEAYNPSTNRWTIESGTHTGRHGLAAVTGPDGRIYAIGGIDPGGKSLNTVEAFDTKSNIWATVASMPTARAYLAAATGPDGRIYAIGGFQEGDGKRLNSVEAYDTKTNTWTTVASMPTARNALAAATGPDGRIYAIGGHSQGGNLNTVEAYDTKSNTWTGVASMPTVRGQLAATTGRDGRIYVIGGGGTERFLNTVEALVFSPGKSATKKTGQIPVMDGTSKKNAPSPKSIVGEIRQFVGHSLGVVDVALAPNGRTAVSGGEDKTLILWDLESGKEVRRFEGHTARVCSVCFTPDGLKIVSGSQDKTIRLWETETGKELRRFEHDLGINTFGVLVTPDGKQIVSACDDDFVRIWDLGTGKEMRRFDVRFGLSKSIALWVSSFSADGRFAFTCSTDDAVRMWYVDKGTQRGQLNHDHPSRCAAFSADGKLAIMCGLDNHLLLYDVGNVNLIRRFKEEPSGFYGATFSPDAQRVLTPCERKNEVVLWDVNSGKAIYRLAGNPLGVSRVIFSPDGKRALSAGRDGSVRLWGLPD
jgi:serine/threonine protein kinase/WD40 repeat protein